MAHLPETLDDLDEPLPASDPVVRAPKAMVPMPEVPSYAMRTVVGVCLVALAIGASLGGVGIAIVYATHARSAFGSNRQARARTAPAAAAPTSFTLTAPDAAANNSGAAVPPIVAAGPFADYAIRTE